MDDQNAGFDPKFEEDEYPRKPVSQAGKPTDAEIAEEQAEFVNELASYAHTTVLKFMNEAYDLDAQPALQEKKINMACKVGGLFAKLVATSAQHNKARRGY